MDNEDLRIRLRRIERRKRRAAAAKGDLDRTIEVEMLRIGQAAIAENLARNRKGGERAARTRRLIGLGGLVRLADLLDLHPDALLGALARASQLQGDSKWSTRWRLSGRKLFRDAGADPSAPLLETSKRVSAKDTRLRGSSGTRQLIVAGGIIEKAGLGEMPPDVLAGILRDIADHRNEEERVERWRIAGEAIRTEVIAEVEVKFAAPIEASIGLSLRQIGLRFDRKSLIWMGLADPALARRIAKSAAGVVRVDPRTRRKAGKSQTKENRRGSRARPKRERQSTR